MKSYGAELKADGVRPGSFEAEVLCVRADEQADGVPDCSGGAVVKSDGAQRHGSGAESHRDGAQHPGVGAQRDDDGVLGQCYGHVVKDVGAGKLADGAQRQCD